jgi:hypothetical protein
MRWAWVRCLACNAPDDARRAGAVYKRLNLSDQEMAQRAELATARAPYMMPEPRKPTAVESARAPTPGASADYGRLAELLDSNKKLQEQVTALTAQITEQTKASTEATLLMGRLSAQVATLLEDNAKLRRELDERKTHAPSVPASPSAG